jgi:hypothetical protein
LRQGLAWAPLDVLFQHTLLGQLREPDAESLSHDDFSRWIAEAAGDAETARRVAAVARERYASPEALRAALLAVLDDALARQRASRTVPEIHAFLFRSSASQRLPTGVLVQQGKQLLEALLRSDPAVWFFHLIEEPWFGMGRSPALDWLQATPDRRFAGWLEEAARSGLPIERAREVLRRRLTHAESGGGR